MKYMLYLLPVYRERGPAVPQRESFVGLNVISLVPLAASPACEEFHFVLPVDHRPARGTAGPWARARCPRRPDSLGSGRRVGAPLAPSGPRWWDLPRIYPPTEVLCLRPPGFFFLRGPGKGDPHGPLGRKLLPTRGSGRDPPFPSTRTAKLQSGSSPGCRGCLGGSGVPFVCPYTELPPAPSRPASSAPRTEPLSGCQARCGSKLMKT